MAKNRGYAPFLCLTRTLGQCVTHVLGSYPNPQSTDWNLSTHHPEQTAGPLRHSPAGCSGGLPLYGKPLDSCGHEKNNIQSNKVSLPQAEHSDQNCFRESLLAAQSPLCRPRLCQKQKQKSLANTLRLHRIQSRIEVIPSYTKTVKDVESNGGRDRNTPYLFLV
jgi:hypothetical protein